MNEYIHFTGEEKQRANSVDLENFLRTQGEKLLPSGRDKRLASDHSITIRGNEWYDHSTEEGGLAIDFVKKYYGLSFQDAVNKLLGENCGIVFRKVEKKPLEKKSFELPPKNNDMRRMFAYLVNNRHIDTEIVSFFTKKKLLYESCELSADKTKEYHNAVFVGMDESGTPRHAHKRGIYIQGKSYKGNIDSSDPYYSFHYIGTSDRLYVFEAPIDMLSFITLNKKFDWQKHSYVTLCGLAEHAMLKMLELYPYLNYVSICIDHDKAGIEASEKFSDILSGKGIACERLFPEYKDWNEDIKARYNLYAIPAEEHPQYRCRDEMIRDIEAEIGDLKRKDYSDLKNEFIKVNAKEQSVEILIKLAALSLCLAADEERQIGKESGSDLFIEKLYKNFRAYETRGSLYNRMIELQKLKEQICSQNGIKTATEKQETIKNYETLAQRCLKALILMEIQNQKQEQKPIMAMA